MPLTMWLFIAALFAAVPSAYACDRPTTLSHTVTAIVDGRTLKLDDGADLRLASILPPTAYDSYRRPAAQSPTEAMAVEALTSMALNRHVSISLERQERDRYGRRIGYARLMTAGKEQPTPAEWLHDGLVAAGHARVTLTPEIDAPCARNLLNLEAAAEAAGRGLWRQPLYATKRAADIQQLVRDRSTYQIVVGVVTRVAIHRSAVYLNFGANTKQDFTAKLSRQLLKRARIDAGTLRHLHNRPVRIRGWIEIRGGPLITISRLEHIERLSLSAAGATIRAQPIELLSDITAATPTAR